MSLYRPHVVHPLHLCTCCSFLLNCQSPSLMEGSYHSCKTASSTETPGIFSQPPGLSLLPCCSDRSGPAFPWPVLWQMGRCHLISGFLVPLVRGRTSLGAIAGPGLRASGGLGFSSGHSPTSKLPLGRPIGKLPSLLQNQCLSRRQLEQRVPDHIATQPEVFFTPPHSSARVYPGCWFQLCHLLLCDLG